MEFQFLTNKEAAELKKNNDGAQGKCSNLQSNQNGFYIRNRLNNVCTGGFSQITKYCCFTFQPDTFGNGNELIFAVKCKRGYQDGVTRLTETHPMHFNASTVVEFSFYRLHESTPELLVHWFISFIIELFHFHPK